MVTFSGHFCKKHFGSNGLYIDYNITSNFLTVYYCLLPKKTIMTTTMLPKSKTLVLSVVKEFIQVI